MGHFDGSASGLLAQRQRSKQQPGPCPPRVIFWTGPKPCQPQPHASPMPMPTPCQPHANPMPTPCDPMPAPCQPHAAPCGPMSTPCDPMRRGFSPRTPAPAPRRPAPTSAPPERAGRTRTRTHAHGPGPIFARVSYPAAAAPQNPHWPLARAVGEGYIRKIVAAGALLGGRVRALCAVLCAAQQRQLPAVLLFSIRPTTLFPLPLPGIQVHAGQRQVKPWANSSSSFRSSVGFSDGPM
jgi:hypothetical protein